MQYQERFDKLCQALEGAGAFLVVTNQKGLANIMTIGWAQAGVIWGVPVMTVFVRPSRYTHSLLAAAPNFSVCVPGAGTMTKELSFCGSKSGREYDKARACAFTLQTGVTKSIKYIAGSSLVYQCASYGHAQLKAENIPAAVREKYYSLGDPHTLYFGKIIKVENSKQ